MQEEADFHSQPAPYTTNPSAATIDLLGLCQSMLDITTTESVPDALLTILGVEKGQRRVLTSVDERSQVLASLQDWGCFTKISPGGSLANTLVGVARLGAAAGFPLSVALGGGSSPDALGRYFCRTLSEAGVSVVDTNREEEEEEEEIDEKSRRGTTGTVFVLPSQDGQRSFLSFFAEEQMSDTNILRMEVNRAALVVVEGYLWGMPGAPEAIAGVVAAAQSSGTRVAFTAGDPGVVARHREAILKVLASPGGSEVSLFANREEACELLGHNRACSAASAAAELGTIFRVAVVTDGGNGSFVSCPGHPVMAVPPAEVPLPGVVDTCGAGDAYAAGFLFATMAGHACDVAGRFASEVAARVVSRHGAQLSEVEAMQLVGLLPVGRRLPPSRSMADRMPVSF